MENTPAQLEGAVKRTLAWFSLFTFPLTLLEVHKWLMGEIRTYSMREVQGALDTLVQKGDVLEEQGFYTLKTYPLPEWVSERRARFLNAWGKFRKLRMAARWFACLSSVRAVAAVNTLAWNFTNKESDIDLLIIVRPGQLWITRLLLVLPFKLLGLRPQVGVKQGEAGDPFCFSFFLSADQLNISSIGILPDDPYLAQWVFGVVPIFDRDGVLENFVDENAWAHTIEPQAFVHTSHADICVRPWGAIPFPYGWFERVAKWIQYKRLPEGVTSLADQGTAVVLNEHMLKFHQTDAREALRSQWVRLCKDIS